MSTPSSVTQTALAKKKVDLFEFFYKYGTIMTIVILTVIFAVSNPSFIQTTNLINILRSISIVTIIAIGITISLTVDGFDLSVGSVASLANAIVISMFVWFSQDTLIAILAAIGASLVVGALNSFMIVKLRIPDMLMTLATMFIIQGIALTYTKGATVSQNMVMPDGTFAAGLISPFFAKIGQVPWIILIMAVIVIATHIFLTYTKHGRYMYMIGGNKEAARLSGISVYIYKVLAYLLSALFAAIGGICPCFKGHDIGNQFRVAVFNGCRCRSLHWFLRFRSGKTECLWNLRRCNPDRNPSKWTDHDVCSILCNGYRQRNSAGPCTRVNLLQTKTLTLPIRVRGGRCPSLIFIAWNRVKKESCHCEF